MTPDPVSATRRVVRYVLPIFMGTDESLVALKNARNTINGARRNIVQGPKAELNLTEAIQSDLTATTPAEIRVDLKLDTIRVLERLLPLKF